MEGWLINRQEINFTKILDELARFGISRHEAARRINVPYTTLNSWHSGTEPRFNDGSAILTLYMITKKQCKLSSVAKLDDIS